ncbi:MAG: hypothetical protein CME85_03955 [Henriciella sp.]|jgi:redox-sensitive bicupin YhaK (pirin superfamily)|uniref:pirin family protein n=1 Tax=Henriciella sp. TaxID=1968823 RepID=UPI000C0DC46A|nr:pirin family protein [Henriciella sp.]MAN73508.1 hypothetical protein [Henriciella sp.]MBF34850.1 hypothetical protein [Hyphomonadaceae bacterium]MBK74636.1 hypothetical protein [Henriciella sp.]PHR78730.1 MAG: hypothetical protein COA64_07040 [Henriciella sp.]|tara:strand:- start:922 stop:1620 length:699 start_codon:yes stop_codon:yes gene_type:complete
MIDIRRFDGLGTFRNEWLDAHYHFSFSQYYDPSRMGHGKLRVWNDDKVRPHTGFPPHGHRDMEIITYVRSGAITHQDSMGNKGRTEAGDVQVMSAGRGVQHSEWNAEDDETTLFQIWIEPAEAGGAPGWGARKFPKADRSGTWATLASGDKADNALPIRQDAKVLGATVKAGETLEYSVSAGRHGYLVLATGSVDINRTDRLNARDGVAITGPEKITITGVSDAEIVLVDTI